TLIPIVFACNGSNGNSNYSSKIEQNESHGDDSSVIVDGNEAWQKLLSINNQSEEGAQNKINNTFVSQSNQTKSKKENMKEITLGAGCFWCIEACFLDIK